MYVCPICYQVTCSMFLCGVRYSCWLSGAQKVSTSSIALRRYRPFRGGRAFDMNLQLLQWIAGRWDDGRGVRRGSLQAYRRLMEHTNWTIFGPALLDDITKKAITTVLQNLNFFIGNEFIEIRGWWFWNPSFKRREPLQPNEATHQNFLQCACRY